MNVRADRGARSLVLAALLCLAAALTPASAATEPPSAPSRAVATSTAEAPHTWDKIRDIFLLRQYNTRVVVIGTTLLGIAAGVVGTFAYLRKRALMGDALSHATLPGIALAFILTGTKELEILILGGAASGVVGVLAVIGLRRYSRLKEDAAIGIVLSVFFGMGMVLFSVIQQMKTGHQAGLQTFIYGKAAAMIGQDAALIGGTAVAAILAAVALFKEFRLVCFDMSFAAAQGWPVLWIDILMMGLVVLTTVIGLQAVGLIMVVALLIIPPAAARFWTDDMLRMTILAGVIGAFSGWAGSCLSAVAERLPTGPIIVLCAGLAFTASMFFSPHRGVIATLLRRRSFSRRINYQNLLRAFAEFEERAGRQPVALGNLLRHRGWSPATVRRLLGRALRQGDVVPLSEGHYALSDRGRAQGRRILRNHRLWELYLVRYADIAPSHVDRDADEVEHVLSPELIQELERTLEQQPEIPPSPHRLEAKP